jgi:fructose-bisphosphate aldolase class 1
MLSGVPFVDVLKKEGIVPGIKADTGMQVRCVHLRSQSAHALNQ